MMRFHRLELDQQQPLVQDAASQQHQETDRDEHYWMQAADQNRRSGQYEEALRHYSRALETNRMLVACWVGQVQMLVLLGEYPEAELWSRKALELFKSNGDLLAGRAQALCRSGDFRQAQGACDSALAQQGQSAYPWMVRGELMLARRDRMADCCFDKAVQLDADWLVLLEIALIHEHYRLPAKALARTRQAVEKAPDHAYCWYRQGAIEAELGLDRAARLSLGRCLELVPNHLEAQRQMHALGGGGRLISRMFRRLRGL